MIKADRGRAICLVTLSDGVPIGDGIQGGIRLSYWSF